MTYSAMFDYDPTSICETCPCENRVSWEKRDRDSRWYNVTFTCANETEKSALIIWAFANEVDFSEWDSPLDE